MTTKIILGVKFYAGGMPGLLERTIEGGLIVVPSAPVMVNLAGDPAHRLAIEGSDFAIADSGFMVLLWRVLKGERIERISGLRYLRALLDWPQFRQPGATFWVMPSATDALANRTWLNKQGVPVQEADCYVAPRYAARGALSDEALLKILRERRPRFVMINLGGGVQERLGFALKQSLEKAESGKLKAEDSDPNASASTTQVSGPAYRPALICTGAAIAFLSGRQVGIPVWVDRLFLGWLWRTASAPGLYLPRYWQSLRLVALLWKHGEKSVTEPPGTQPR